MFYFYKIVEQSWDQSINNAYCFNFDYIGSVGICSGTVKWNSICDCIFAVRNGGCVNCFGTVACAPAPEPTPVRTGTVPRLIIIYRKIYLKSKNSPRSDTVPRLILFYQIIKISPHILGTGPCETLNSMVEHSIHRRCDVTIIHSNCRYRTDRYRANINLLLSNH